MAEVSTIARPYAEALFRVARNGDLGEWAGVVGNMAAVAGNPEMRAVIGNPRYTVEQIEAVFTGALSWKLNAEGHNFVRMLVQNGRLAVMPEIADQFLALKNAHEKSADAKIISAFELSDKQLNDLVAALERKFNTKLNASVVVDPALIGGVRVVVGDQVLDTSVRTRLEQMRAALVA